MPMTYRSRCQVEDDRPRLKERIKNWLGTACYYRYLRQLSQEETFDSGETALEGCIADP